MNKRICIFGILLIIFAIPDAGSSFLGSVLMVVGPIVMIIGVLIKEQKAKD